MDVALSSYGALLLLVLTSLNQPDAETKSKAMSDFFYIEKSKVYPIFTERY